MANFIIGDYKYTTFASSTPNTVKVTVVDNTKSTYSDIPATVTYNGVTYNVISLNECFTDCKNLSVPPNIPITITNMGSCFYNCTSLVTAPVIPNSVTEMGFCFEGCTALTTAPIIPSSVVDMRHCFGGCTSLVNAPVIPSSVTDMWGCFAGCTSLVNAPAIPSSVVEMRHCFAGCTSLSGDIYIYTTYDSLFYIRCFYDTSHTICLHAMNNNIEECDALAGTANNNNVYVNVKPETALNFNNTQVNYLNQNSEFIALSMQTNANLIQCRVPKLIGGGASIITTNLNDALIDLYRRKVGGA